MSTEPTNAATKPSVLVYSAMPYDEETLAAAASELVDFSLINVIVTGHQAFFTNEALEEIASTTVANVVTHFAADDGAT